jgi:hypothetical protein
MTNYSMELLKSYNVGAGSHPTLSMNGNLTIIAGWASTASTKLYCKIGVYSVDGNNWIWGDESHYDDGDSAALAINNQKVVVDVHRSSTGSNNLFCRVGNVNTESLDVNWGPSVQFNAGGTPIITLNDNNTVIAVWSSTTDSHNLFYCIGMVDPDSLSINWYETTKYDGGSHPTVDMNNLGQVILGHASTESTKLYYQLGALSSDGKSLVMAPGSHYDDGDQNYLTIDDTGLIWESHRSSNSNDIYFSVGQLNTSAPVWAVEWDKLSAPEGLNSEVVRLSMPSNNLHSSNTAVSIDSSDTTIETKVWSIVSP